MSTARSDQCPMNLNPLNVQLDAGRQQTTENARPSDCCTNNNSTLRAHKHTFYLARKRRLKIAFSIYADKRLSRVMAPNDFRISFKCFPCERFCLLLMVQVASTTKHDDTFALFFSSHFLFLFLFVFSCVFRIRCFSKQFWAAQSI